MAPVAPQTTGSPAPPFAGIVDYRRFAFDWEAASWRERLAICGDFYAANPPQTDVVPSTINTGPEVIEYFNAQLDVLSALNSDKSNPANYDVAVKIAECLTTNHNPDLNGLDDLTTQLDTQAHSGFEGLHLKKIDSNQVTRYSANIYTANGSQGEAWAAKVVEGYIVDEFGKELFQQVFEWQVSDNFTGFRYAFRVRGDVSFDWGNQPIILDESRADAPWQGQ